MLVYASTPAEKTEASGEWPAASSLARDPERPTLVMFLHPQCPCSRASLAELERLATQCRDRFSLRIVFVHPQGLPRDSEHSSLRSAAQRILGAVVSTDKDGVEAERYGVTTSGEALLYAADGRLLFQGGLTGARGHEGDNAGRDAVTARIESSGASGASLSSTPVFGCALGRECRQNEREAPCK
jgi:hypothetical protein